MPDPPQDALRGVVREVALERVEALLATLGGGDPGPEARAWAADALLSLDGLLAQVAPDARPPDPADPVAELVALRARLAAAGGTGRGGPVPLRAALEAAAAEARRVAGLAGVRLAVELVVPEDVALPRPAARVLVDALGQVARVTARDGLPRGGALRAVATLDPDGLVIVVSDRAERGLERDRHDVAAARETALRLARARLATAGGELSLAAGAWGGTSVTMRLPLAR